MDEFKSGYIRVTMDTINYKNVCDYYNQNKPDDWKPIYNLDRVEGGFCIDLENNYHLDANDNIKQIRWKNRKLLPHSWCQSFNKEETYLLYQTLWNLYPQNENGPQVFLE
jgi:hypothetical protein